MELPFEYGIEVMAAAEKQYNGDFWDGLIKKDKPLRPKKQTEQEVMNNVNRIIRATVR